VDKSRENEAKKAKQRLKLDKKRLEIHTLDTKFIPIIDRDSELIGISKTTTSSMYDSQVDL
jgi:hypothetical protein